MQLFLFIVVLNTGSKHTGKIPGNTYPPIPKETARPSRQSARATGRPGRKKSRPYCETKKLRINLQPVSFNK